MHKKKFIILCFTVMIFTTVFGKKQTVHKFTSKNDSLLVEFRKQSGINAMSITDTSILNTARRWQGHGEYPGVDDWITAKIPNHIKLYGGLPGQSAFYSISNTVRLADTLQTGYWKSLQVQENPTFGYRPCVGVFEVKDSLIVAIAKTLANH